MSDTTTAGVLGPRLAAKAQRVFDTVWDQHAPAHGTDIVRRNRIRTALRREIVEHLAEGDEDVGNLVRAGHLAIVREDLGAY
jgi:hypothetical protein